jgi:hypothetical protein
MSNRTKIVLKNNKTTKSLKITIGDSKYNIIMDKKIVKPIGYSNCELRYSSRRYYGTDSFFLVPGWERISDIRIPRDLINDMLVFLYSHNESFSEDSLCSFDSTEKYNKLYNLDEHVVRLCSTSNYIYVGRGGTYTDSSFLINLLTNEIEPFGDHDVNSLLHTKIPLLDYVHNITDKDCLDDIEVRNFECSLLPNYKIYKELREFIEMIRNDKDRSYEWPFKTFLPYGDIL